MKTPRINPAWIAANPKKTGHHLVLLTPAGAKMEPHTREQLEAQHPRPKTKAEKKFYRVWGYLPTWRKIR